VHRAPGALSLDQACNLLGNYETAYHCLVTRGRVQADETVLINGASGSTGVPKTTAREHAPFVRR
jgi:NADPH2:quinone reductase